MTPNIRIKWEKAKDFIITDTENKKYIDFTSGVFASSIGYNNTHLKKMINNAMNKGLITLIIIIMNLERNIFLS